MIKQQLNMALEKENKPKDLSLIFFLLVLLCYAISKRLTSAFPRAGAFDSKLGQSRRVNVSFAWLFLFNVVENVLCTPALSNKTLPLICLSIYLPAYLFLVINNISPRRSGNMHGIFTRLRIHRGWGWTFCYYFSFDENMYIVQNIYIWNINYTWCEKQGCGGV